jgi:adenylate cyclase
VKRKLSKDLPDTLTYHNLEHTVRVVEAAKEIGLAEGLRGEALENLLIAAWFHDIGYLKNYVGHEEESQQMAQRFLEEIMVDETRIAKIQRLIMATKFRHAPSDHLEKILIDADRVAMGASYFIPLGEHLRQEWGTYLQKTYTDLEWTEVQLQYLEETQFFTTYAGFTYGFERQNNQRRLKAIIESLDKKNQGIYVLSLRTLSEAYQWFIEFFWVLVLGMGVGLSLSLAVWGVKLESWLTGIFAGLCIGLGLKLFDPIFEARLVRRFSFPITLVLGTIGLVVLFLGAQGFALVVFHQVPEWATWVNLPAESLQAGYKNLLSLDSLVLMGWSALLISLILNFIKLTGRIVGPRVLWNYVRGKYFRPVQEDRIFMFVDLNSSTRMAETMELTQYHELLSMFFKDMAGPISRSKGEIYQYVGDEVVISWEMKEGLRRSTCIRCYFRLRKQMDKSAPMYLQKFGFIPDFKVALHGGSVITGEVGKYKTEIVFHGEVLNTAERMLNQCKPMGTQVLISELLLKKLDILPNIQPKYVASIKLKGKESDMSLYTLSIKNSP